jgi:hypothetical protein
MPNIYTVPVFTLLFIMLLSMYAPATAAFSWKDDFNYQNVSELTNAGRAATNVYLNNGTVSPIEPMVYQHFPQELYDFSFEVRQMIGNLSSFGIRTERHNYTLTSYFLSDDTFGYGFVVDGQTELQLTQFQEYSSAPELYYAFQWHTLTLQKSGNLFNLFVDGTLRGSYTQPDNKPDGLVSVELNGNDTYDYVSVTSLGGPQLYTRIFFIALIILIAVAATSLLFSIADIKRLRRRKRTRSIDRSM